MDDNTGFDAPVKRGAGCFFIFEGGSSRRRDSRAGRRVGGGLFAVVRAAPRHPQLQLRHLVPMGALIHRHLEEDDRPVLVFGRRLFPLLASLDGTIKPEAKKSECVDRGRDGFWRSRACGSVFSPLGRVSDVRKKVAIQQPR